MHRKVETFQSFIRQSQRIALISHLNADPDALSSMIATKTLIKTINKDTHVFQIAPDGLNEVSKRLAIHFKEKVLKTIQLNSNIDIAILIDTSSLSLLGDLETDIHSFKGKIIVIDHHNSSSHLPKKTLKLINRSSTSCSELVLNLYNTLNIKLTRRTAQLLLAGICSDSKFFTIGDLKTFEAVVQLLKCGAKIDEAVSLLQSQIGRSEKIARLKAATRCRLFEINGFIFAFSEVRSYQASTARALINIGADLSVVYGINNGNLRINIRSTKSFTKVCRHIGKSIAMPLGIKLGGSGGGHNMAAGVNVNNWSHKSSNIILDSLQETLKELPTPLYLKELK